MGNRQSQRKRAEVESTEGASTSSSISSAATSVGTGHYDVFLSFRGSDTRKEFTDHLYQSLVKVGIVPIYVFKDDKSIPIGNEFSSQIFDAIARSKISIPIISENYASSKWCLLELIHIMDHKKSSSLIVLPIFYKVAPANVRHLTGNFGDAFRFCLSQERFDEKIIQEGQEALREVSDLHGWESTKVANGHEGELIQLVVKTVLSELQKDFQLAIPRKLVGLDDRLMEIKSWIRSPSEHARMIGIYGMGGIGKTTLAKCIYSQLLDEFEHASFLPNIRERATHHDGMKDLQSQLISNILRSENKVSTVDEGISIIKSRFKRKKIIILLDDIDGQDQLDVLVGERDWFKAGSMIIVTTRNEAVLVQSEFEVDYKYEMEGLDEVQSLLLFNRHTFRTDHSREDFESISRDIISTMDGLPLALEVVGSLLYKKTNKKVWEDVRRQLKRQPHRDVEKILRISYDALEDGHKQIFLDIACFFIGKSLDYLGKYMMCMWENCGLYPSLGIEELKLRCLIKIGDDGEFEMHDQLRDLGRSIFCQGQPLEKRNGPWDDDYEGVPRVLREDDCWERFHDVMWAASRGDKDLSEVRWLQWRIEEIEEEPIAGDRLRSSSSRSPRLQPMSSSEVRQLQSKIDEWSILTANLHLPKLAVLELASSDIAEDWVGWSSLKASKWLRALDLAHCSNLRSTPDLSAFTKLKILELYGCSELEHLHPSIGELKSLVSLDLTGCENLNELPEQVGELKDLEELDLSSSGITQIPTSIRSLRKLKRLDAVYCKSLRGIPSSIGDLQNLQHLDIHSSGIEELPKAIGMLKNLQTLDISWTPISHVPESIQNLSSLRDLNLDCCDKLQLLPQLPMNLTCLTTSGQILRLSQLFKLIHLEDLFLLGDIPELPSRLLKLNGFRYLEAFTIISFSSIETLDLSELIHLERLSVFGCQNLVEIQGPIDGAKFLETLDIMECESLETLPDLTECEKLQYLRIRDCMRLHETYSDSGT